MKYYILLIYLLAFSLATEGNTAVKDSLSEALPSASSPLQKLEIMTNLMDLSRQEELIWKVNVQGTYNMRMGSWRRISSGYGETK